MPPLRSLLAALATAATVGGALPEPALHRSPLALAPSHLQLQTLPRFEPRWVLPPSLGSQLVFRGVRPALVDELLARVVPAPDAPHGVIVPDRALLARFTAEERATLHGLLATRYANVAYRWPLSLGPDELRALAAQPRWAEALARLRATALPHGDRLVFSDLFALEDAFATPADRLDFYGVVLGADILLLKLRRQLDRPLDAQAQAAWWQVNGRHRSIEPLLNAIAAIPNAPRLDVAHLLPRLPRSLLNTYPPRLGESQDPGADSSLVASDFFALVPGADPKARGGLKDWLDVACEPVDGPPQFGDLYVFGDLVHNPWPYTAVYVAGGIGFARRPTAFGPWQFLDLAEVGRLNPRFAATAPQVFRLKSARVTPGEPPFIPGRLPDAWRRQLSLKPVPPGPWGRLWYYDVLLAPSGNTLEQLPAPDPEPVWTFTGLTPTQLAAAAGEVPMPPEVRAGLLALFATARPDPAGQVTVHPTLDLVLAVPREFRARVFPHLVGGLAVTDYTQHIPFPAGFTIEEWFDAGSLPESVRQAILRLVYPVGERVLLSDLGALYRLLPSRREQLSAHRAALRVPAVVLLMEKPAAADVPALADYWRLGRAKDAGRLLGSFAAGGDDLRYLDIIHLLSPIEREFLNSYFTPDQAALTPSCFWAAFNFGAEKPDDRYLVLPGVWTEHQAMAWQELGTSFDPIPAPGRLGDIIAYRRRGSAEAIHVCVFIADGIVYTKNGATFSKPWCLSRLEDIDELYLTGPDLERVYFRRRPPAP